MNRNLLDAICLVNKLLGWETMEIEACAVCKNLLMHMKCYCIYILFK